MTPTDPAKYEADRQACVAEGVAAERQARAGSFFPSAGEILGRMAPGQDKNDPSTYAGQGRIIDRCMTERGYQVLER